MPRIRSIKPEFWTDSKVVGLSAYARLLFIGAWNFADDYGCLPPDATQLKLRVLPADPVNPEELIEELLKIGLLEVLEYDGDQFWHITHWNRHQRVKNPSSSEFGNPTTWTPIPTRAFPEDIGELPEESGGIRRSGKGVEGSGREGSGRELAPKSARDEVWDALALLFGEPTTESNRSLRGKLVKSLSSAGATAEEITRRAMTWPDHFPEATITETALEKHWDRLGLAPARATEQYQAEVRSLNRERRAAELDAQQRGLPG